MLAKDGSAAEIKIAWKEVGFKFGKQNTPRNNHYIIAKLAGPTKVRIRDKNWGEMGNWDDHRMMMNIAQERDAL